MKAVVSTLHVPEMNLALEEFLFNQSEDYILFYVNDPCVILGSNQVLTNEVNVEFCLTHDIRIQRRITGGGTVFHDHGNLNYAFIKTKLKDQPALTDDFLVPVIEVLNELEIPAVQGQRRDIWLVEGFKISGTASHMKANRVIQHGTLLYDADLEALQNALQSPEKDANKKGIASVPSPVKNISAFLKDSARPSMNTTEFFELFSQLVIRKVGAATPVLNETDLDQPEVEAIAHNRYYADSWIKKK